MHGSHVLQPTAAVRTWQDLVQHQPLTLGAPPASLQKLLAVYVELTKACMKMKCAANPRSERSCLCSVWRDKQAAGPFLGIAGACVSQAAGGAQLCAPPLGSGLGLESKWYWKEE